MAKKWQDSIYDTDAGMHLAKKLGMKVKHKSFKDVKKNMKAVYGHFKAKDNPFRKLRVK